jgi:hypothetical protein
MCHTSKILLVKPLAYNVLEVCCENNCKKIIKAFIPFGLIVFYQHYCKNKKQKIINDNHFTWEMTENEQKLFRNYIFDKKVYLEFGSGGSTIAALINNKKYILQNLIKTG